MRLRGKGHENSRSKPKSQLTIEKEKETEISITKLTPGSVFGESDCLSIIGYEFLGDIFAGKAGLECLVIPQPDLVLQHFERQILKNLLQNQHHRLISMAET